MTLLVAGGRVHALDRALARLQESVRTLFDVDVPAGLRDELGRLGAAGARVRADIDPAGRARVRSAPFTPPGPGGALVRPVLFVLPGGLGAHDWTDRRLARDLARRAGDDSVALIADADGTVLGALDAALLVVGADGRVLAPPDDGRHHVPVDLDALPVTDRGRITVDDLHAAARLIVVDVLHGPRPAAAP